jgi:phosphonate transport system substrate-binding protein
VRGCPRRGLSRARRFVLPLLAAALLALAGCPVRPPSQTPVRVGFMICNSLEETRARFAPVTAYLEEQLGRRFVPVYLDTGDFDEALRKKQFDLIHTNSFLYAWFHESYQFRILAGERRGEHGAYSRGTIITRRDSGLRTLADLKGKRFVFGPSFAPTAYLSPYWLLLEAGVDPEKDLAFYAFPPGSYKHEKAIYSVLYGAYDAGIGPALDLELMVGERKITRDDFTTLAEGPLIPYCVFSAAPTLPAETFGKIQAALFSLKEESTAAVDGEVLKVLKAAGVEGFTTLREEEFDTVRAMAKRCNLPPYAKY